MAKMEKMATAEKAAHDRAEATAKQNREMYTLAIQQAQRAMTQKNYDVAIAKYQEAGKLFNTDAVISGLRQVADARKKDEDQTRQMALADAARKKQAELDQRLKEAEAKMLVDAKVKKEAEDARRTSMVEADKKKRLADYIRAMTDGQTAMKARTYDVAVKLYTEALRLQPGDQAATAGLRNAQTMMAPPAQPSQPPPPKPAAYTLQIQAAANFAKQQKYDEALAAYTAALRIVPKDVPASVGYYLMTGQKNLKAKKNAEAVKAFEDVLRLSPNHAEATAGLKQAQQ